MTQAARELGLTQSGVSQHMKALEETLKLKLFDRVTQKLVPTAQANVLYENCSRYLSSLEDVIGKLQAGEDKVLGNVSIGMPIEFGNNLLTPLLAKFCHDNSMVNLSLQMGFADEMNDGLLNGELDFAFVDTYHLDKRIEAFKVFDETLHLVASKPYCLEHSDSIEKMQLEDLDFVCYQANASVIKMWFKQKLSKTNVDLKVRAHVRDVQAVARLVCSGLGCGVLPGYLLSQLKSAGHELISFGDPKVEVHNSISVAYLKEKSLNHAARTLKHFLLAGLNAHQTLS